MTPKFVSLAHLTPLALTPISNCLLKTLGPLKVKISRTKLLIHLSNVLLPQRFPSQFPSHPNVILLRHSQRPCSILLILHIQSISESYQCCFPNTSRPEPSVQATTTICVTTTASSMVCFCSVFLQVYSH